MSSIPSEVLTALHNPVVGRERLASLGVWVTANGERIWIKSIRNDHLLNIARFLVRQAEEEVKETRSFYYSEPMPQGEMALDCYWQEFDFITSDSCGIDVELVDHPFYYHLLKELYERGLLNQALDNGFVLPNLDLYINPPDEITKIVKEIQK